MHNKTVVVTGANSGVGFVTAKQLAEAGATIVMVCRDARRGEDARARIAQSATGPPPELFIADLSSQEAIRDLARDIHFAHDQIDVLLNNAGGVFAKRELNADGIENTFATNHLAPFLLTNLLLDLVKAAPAGRIVTVATEVYANNSTSPTCRASAATSSSRHTSTRSCATSCSPSNSPAASRTAKPPPTSSAPDRARPASATTSADPSECS